MSSNNHGTRFDGFMPGQINVIGDTRTENVIFDLPGGREAAMQVRTQLEEPEVRAKQREEFMATVNPVSLTEGLEKYLTRLNERLNEITGYDKQGKPQFRLVGREREIAEMQAANRRNALVQARRVRAEAERVQAQAKAAKAAENARIEVAAQAKAKQLVEEAEIERRAKQIAARVAGVRN